MAGKLTTHVLDIANGVGAAGLAVTLRRPGGEAIANGRLDHQGRATLLAQGLGVGRYEIVFAVADYHRQAGLALSDPPFLDLVTVAFGVADPDTDYHVPLLLSAFGYSTYRGV